MVLPRIDFLAWDDGQNGIDLPHLVGDNVFDFDSDRPAVSVAFAFDSLL